MKYFVSAGEDRRLDEATRRTLRGDYIRLSDGVTHYELAGPDGGDVVVLAGGLTIPLFYWDELAVELHARGLRTLAYSGYGRGYSDRVVARYDEALFVRQLRELVEHLQVPAPCHVVGTSMGALIAMAYVSQHVASTATLTLVGPAGLSRQPVTQKLVLGNDTTASLIAKYFGRRILEQHLGHNVADANRAAALADMIGDASRYEGSIYAFFQTLQHFPLFDRAELYRHTGTLHLPTQLIWGREDHVTPISSLDQVRELLQPSQYHVIDDCGHMAPFERPLVVADQLATFYDTFHRSA
ncbi:hydrolase [Mycolicibacterium mageritense DSM 44476 = CIP 104973]|uniref:4,5:9,10-diseco-3-hydroxy-5,9, 17-trioxoandrosta-1(10),2-diene-4-oate hydrolase n=2 Tax=Mycolicibacterium mageritense TaxID=53462 RepID=A0AAI8XRW8_MYCME|nr:alpha/beta hydrolase [Mycolicibacterium mageritense]BBX37884.1 alpha/beta hydrolase [Mycolicibacterium mageritense]BDY32576.1 4,5:9,10-diseco-3-hydroxy-5,9, 17-trioxoandrosta-1(10),2-diene-4-oate hydrolase [Mycolicibacterium mageritense]CDO25447.1 2-hydroxy-6-oxo-6-phenylhexa-2,4-dienoate hydrolase BphD [Mycolicibacterium mageritense DSM 44476 = CIP 104973]